MKVNTVFASKESDRAGFLLEALARNNFSVTVARRMKEVLGLLAQKSCDLLMVGQHLLDEDGVNLVKTLRSRSVTQQLPIVAILEHGDPVWISNSTDQGHGRLVQAPGGNPSAGPRQPLSLRLIFFQVGADECLTLNQDVAECMARIKAVLRRTMAHPAEEILRMGEVELNLSSYTLRVSDREVPLTSKELDLLYVFLSSPNRVLSRPYLIERVWGYNYFGSPRTVDVHVRRLREKLGKASRFIQTISCVGYKLVPPGSNMSR